MGWFGDAKPAIEALVEAHYAPLFRYAYRLSGSAPMAEDLTQETFCLAQKSLHQLREPERAKSWLFSILRNAYLHDVRANKLDKQVSLDGIPEIPDRAADPEPMVDSAKLQQALNELTEAFRTPLILYYFEDFSYRDIAEQMKVPLGTVMSRLARAKTYLRQRLTDQSDLIAKANQGGGTVMDCNDIQQLLAFVDRKSDALDKVEDGLVKLHLERCPICAEMVNAERQFDKTLGPVMRDVTVPTDLKQKVMQRLAPPGGVPWKSGLAAAAAILLVLGVWGVWYVRSPINVKLADVQSAFSVPMSRIGNWGTDEKAAQEYLNERGLIGRVPPRFNYEHLQHVDVIEFKDRPVAKLTFAKAHEATAFVLILPWEQFRTTELQDDGSSFKVVRDEEHKVTYLIMFRGNLHSLYLNDPLN